MEIVQLKKGGTALEVWAGADSAFGPKGGVIDGISVLGKRVYANTLVTSKLFMVPIEAGAKAGKVTEAKLDRAISRPDGPVAVTVVGTTAYVLEGQLMAFMRPPGANSPPPPTKPFKATAVPVGEP